VALTRAKAWPHHRHAWESGSRRPTFLERIQSFRTFVRRNLIHISLYENVHCYSLVVSSNPLNNTVPADRNLDSLLPTREASLPVMDPSPMQSPMMAPSQNNADGATSDIPSQSLAFGGSSYNVAAADKPRPLPIRFHSSDDNNPARRTSVQFMPNVRVAGPGAATENSRSRSRRPIPIKETSVNRRLSSPPPPT
jgi:hypothetical protein